MADRRYPTDRLGLPEGLLAAIVGWLLLLGSFVPATLATPMPPAERWAAITTFALLALATTLPGCAALYDGLGRAVRRDWRALAALAALVPALYLAYAAAVRELTPGGAAAALLFAAVPAAAFGGARGSRGPHPLDVVALAYLLISLRFLLLPPLTLPQQGGQVGFFQAAVAPLLLLLFAWRGWPGLGYSWHLSGPELRDLLLAALAGALLTGLYGLLSNTLDVGLLDGGQLFRALVGGYFLLALPTELLLRGGLQNGLARALAGRLGRAAPWAALALTAALSAAVELLIWRGLSPAAPITLVLSLAAGWVYMRSGKVTASAASFTLIAVALGIMAGR